MMSGAEKVEVVIKETGLICTERSLTKGLGSPQFPQSAGATPFLYMYTPQNLNLYRSNHHQYLSSGNFSTQSPEASFQFHLAIYSVRPS